MVHINPDSAPQAHPALRVQNMSRRRDNLSWSHHDLAAAYLAKRFGLPPSIARLLAELAGLGGRIG